MKGTYSFVSLGCPKNLVDSERMLGLLERDGYQLVESPDGADLAVINTCGFIHQARQESLAAIDQMLALKAQGRLRGVIVAGCMAERDRDALLVQRPGIDAVVGVFARDQIARVADRLLGDLQEQRTVFRPAPVRALADRQRLRVTPRHFAYVKIADGCDRACTFCAIPKIRGRHASKTIEQVVGEAEELAADGVRELILVSQDTTYYGIDQGGRPRLTQLLGELQTVAGIDWIRLMYLYPMYIDQPLMETIASSRKILPYLDLPLQHINDRMLRRMSRRVTRAQTERLLAELRSRIPDLVLRTTLIAGFPGETDRQFEELVEFVRRQRFERLGVFAYSNESGTPAARMTGQVPDTVKQARRDRLMEVQQKIAFAWNRQQVGRRPDVILDRPIDRQHNVWVGRSAADAPDIDPVVYVTGDRQRLSAGDIVPCEIVAHQDYDLAAVAVAQEDGALGSAHGHGDH